MTLRLFAIGIDEAREMFGAAPDVAGRLREIAGRTYAVTGNARVGLLDRIGPLLRKPLPPHGPEWPTRDDMENLIAGRYVTPDRLVACWRLFGTWLAECSVGELRLEDPLPALEALDFDLASVGLPAPVGVATVFRNDAQLPLRALPGMRVGYARHAHALAMADEIRRVLPAVDGRSRRTAETIQAWLAGFHDWGQAAAGVGRPAPDALALLFTEVG